MPLRLQFILAGLVAVYGISVAIYQIFWLHYFCSSIGVITAAALVIITIFFGFFAVREYSSVQIIVAIFTVSSVAAAFTDTNLFDTQRQATLAQLQDAFRNITFVQWPPLNPNEQKTLEKGMTACALQSNLDQIEAAIAAAKSIYFGPALTLYDFAFGLINPISTQSCFEQYQILKKTRPSAFSALKEDANSYLKLQGY